MVMQGETLATGAARTCSGCKKTPVLQVCRSAAGHYVGTWCDCGPYSRESDYCSSEAEAQAMLADMLLESMDENSVEGARALLMPAVNALADDEINGPVWTPQELAEQFEVVGFAAPFVVVRRKSDRAMGSLLFRHEPRVYFGWKQDE